MSDCFTRSHILIQVHYGETPVRAPLITATVASFWFLEAPHIAELLFPFGLLKFS